MYLYQYIQTLTVVYCIYRKRFYFELFKDKYIHPDRIDYEKFNFSKKKFKYVNNKNYLKINKVDNNIIIVIDNFFKDLSFLDRFLKKKYHTDSSAFPGIRHVVEYTEHELIEELEFIIFYISKKYFKIELSKNETNINLQYNTYKNNELYKFSTIPHKDSSNILASNCFLFKKNKMYGGTSMYNRKPVNLNEPHYRRYISNIYKNRRYCSDFQEKIFENIFYVRDKFNRIVIYRGNVWHQGIIDYKYFNDDYTEDTPKRYCMTGFYS